MRNIIGAHPSIQALLRAVSLLFSDNQKDEDRPIDGRGLRRSSLHPVLYARDGADDIAIARLGGYPEGIGAVAIIELKEPLPDLHDRISDVKGRFLEGHLSLAGEIILCHRRVIDILFLSIPGLF